MADDVLPRVGEIGPDPPQLARRPGAVRPVAAPPQPAEKPPRPAGTAAPTGRSAPQPPPAPVPPRRAQESDEEPSFEFHKRETQLEEMDLTPMVDVTFLLLIFFMITASFQVQKSIEVPHPDQEKKGAVQSQMVLEDLLDSSIKIDVDAKNAITVDDDPLPRPEELVETLRRKMNNDSKREVILRVDPAAFWELTVTVCDACHAVGMQKIRMAAWEGSGGR
jgi:biopolymer transport protein ExbD